MAFDRFGGRRDENSRLTGDRGGKSAPSARRCAIGGLLAIAGALAAGDAPIATAQADPAGSLPPADVIPANVPRLAAARLGNMLPKETIATLIVDVAGDWQGMNQFDTFVGTIDGLAGFPMIPAIPGRDFGATLRDWAGEQVAIAWLPSDDPDVGSYFVTIAPLADADAATGYREALTASWSGTTAIQTYQGVEILVLSAAEPPAETAPEVAPDDESLEVRELDGAARTSAESAMAESAMAAARKAIADATEIESGPVPSGDRVGVLPSIVGQFAIAQLGDRLVFATSAKAIVQYLDDLQLGRVLPAAAPAESAEPAESANPAEAIETADALSGLPLPVRTLNQNPDFRRTLDREPAEPAAAIAYADMPNLIEALKDLPIFTTPTPDGTVPADLFDLWDDLALESSTAEAFLWFEPSGLRMQFRAYGDGPLSPLADLTREDDETLAHIPAASALALTTRGLDRILPELIAVYDRIPETATQLDRARTAIRDATGLDLDADIVPLFDGDLSFFVFPANLPEPEFQPLIGFLPIGIAATVETGDRAKFETLLDRLDTLWAQTASGPKTVPVETRTIEDFAVTSWSAPTFFGTPSSLAAHTWITDDTLLMTAGAQFVPGLVPEPYLSLMDDYSYRAGFEPFEPQSISRLHVNFGVILSVLNDFLNPMFWESLPSTPQIEPARAVRSLRSLSEATLATDEYVQDDLHLRLAPRRSD